MSHTGEERLRKKEFKTPDSDLNRYTWASIFATLLIAAESFTAYWDLAQVYRTLAFYVLAPLAILFINFAGVFVCHHDPASLGVMLILFSILDG